MNQCKLYIPFTLISLGIVMFAFYSILRQDLAAPSQTNPLEFENIIHHHMNFPLTTDHFNHLEALFPVMNKPEHSFVLLFVSGSDPCDNCFNEIADYLKLAAETPALTNNHYSMLLFHGSVESQAQRYVQASGMAGRVDHSAFIETISLDSIDYYDLIGQYGSHNLLYLIDLTSRNIFHGFVLPAGSTTAWNQKEIVFIDAISHQNNDP